MIIQGLATADVRSTTKSIALPSHRPNDLVAMYTYSLGSESKPAAGGTVPNWIRSLSGSGTIGGVDTLSFHHFIATASNHTSGVWGANCQLFSVIVLRPTGSALSIGASASLPSPIAAYIQFPALTFQALDGTSWGLRAAFREQNGMTAQMANTPSDWTNRSVNPASPNCFQCLHTRQNITVNAVQDQINLSEGGSRKFVGSTVEIREAGPFITSVPLMAIA